MRGAALELGLEPGQGGEWAGLILAHHPRRLQRGFGPGASRVRVERQGERVGQRVAKIDARAVVEDGVELVGAELDLVVGIALRRRREAKRERLVDAGLDRFAGGDARLRQRGAQSSLGNQHFAIALERGVGVEPVKRRNPQPLGDRGAVVRARGRVDPVAVTDLGQ